MEIKLKIDDVMLEIIQQTIREAPIGLLHDFKRQYDIPKYEARNVRVMVRMYINESTDHVYEYLNFIASQKMLNVNQVAKILRYTEDFSEMDDMFSFEDVQDHAADITDKLNGYIEDKIAENKVIKDEIDAAYHATLENDEQIIYKHEKNSELEGSTSNVNANKKIIESKDNQEFDTDHYLKSKEFKTSVDQAIMKLESVSLETLLKHHDLIDRLINELKRGRTEELMSKTDEFVALQRIRDIDSKVRAYSKEKNRARSHTK